MHSAESDGLEVNRPRGGLPTFREEIRRIREKGSRFTVYLDHRFCWSGTKTFDAHAKDWMAHYRPGTPGAYRTPDEACMCFLEPDAWAEHVAATCGRLVRDAGLDGIYLDELNLAFPCYNPAHRHYREGAWPVSVPLLARHVTAARDAMRRENPEAILMTEHAGSDYLSQFADGSWVQTYYRPAIRTLARHSFRLMRKAKLSATFGTDNRTLSRTTVSNEILKAVRAFHITPSEHKNFIIYGFKRSFFPGTYIKKREYARQIIDYYEKIERQFAKAQSR